MNLFMIHLRNLQNAFENVFALVYLVIIQRIGSNQGNNTKNTCDTFNDSKIPNQESQELTDREQGTDETDFSSYDNYKQLIDFLEILDYPFEINNDVINKNQKPLELSDPNFNENFSVIEDKLMTAGKKCDTINDRMFDYQTIKTYWEAMSHTQK